jgi:hypothetical protein
LRRGKADPHGRLIGECGEPFERQGQVRAALVAGQGVDLVHDDGLHRAQLLAALRGCQQQVQRFGRRDEDVWRIADEGLPLGLRRIAGANGGADRQLAQPRLGCEGGDLGQGNLQVALDVVAQRLEGRDVNDLDPFRQLSLEPIAQQPVDADQKRGQRLARAGRGGDQRVLAGGDVGPAAKLRLGGLAETSGEPLADERMEQVERHTSERHGKQGCER